MDSKKVIIIPNENETNAKFYESVGTILYHQMALKKYVLMNEISLSSYNFSSVSDVYFELLQQNFCIITMDKYQDICNVIIYLPDVTSIKQVEFFKNKKEMFRDYQINIFTLNGVCFANCKNESEDKDTIDFLIDVAKKRLPNNDVKAKKLEKKDTNE